MNTHIPAATAEAIEYLRAHGFTGNPTDPTFFHPFAMVKVIDPEAVCFQVYAYTREHPKMGFFQAQLTRVPLSVFAATITAAIG